MEDLVARTSAGRMHGQDCSPSSPLTANSSSSSYVGERQDLITVGQFIKERQYPRHLPRLSMALADHVVLGLVRSRHRVRTSSLACDCFSLDLDHFIRKTIVLRPCFCGIDRTTSKHQAGSSFGPGVSPRRCGHSLISPSSAPCLSLHLGSSPHVVPIFRTIAQPTTPPACLLRFLALDLFLSSTCPLDVSLTISRLPYDPPHARLLHASDDARFPFQPPLHRGWLRLSIADLEPAFASLSSSRPTTLSWTV